MKFTITESKPNDYVRIEDLESGTIISFPEAEYMKITSTEVPYAILRLQDMRVCKALQTCIPVSCIKGKVKFEA